MAKLSLFVLLVVSLYSTGEAKKVLCLYKNWTTYRSSQCTYTQDHEHVSAKYCTHLVYYYADVDSAGNLRASDPYSDLPAGGGKAGYQKINELKNGDDKLSTILSLGDPATTTAFSTIAASEALREEFAKNLVTYLLYYGFDGVLIDWKFPSVDDKDNFAVLLEVLRRELDSDNLSLGVAVPNNDQQLSSGFHVPSLNLADFVVVDSYFYRELSYGVFHPSPLYKCKEDRYFNAAKENVAYAVEMYERQGLQPEKIIVGAYGEGRSFTVSNPTSVTIGSVAISWGQRQKCTSVQGTISYDESCEASWKNTYLESCAATLLVKDDLVAAVESPESVAAKAEFAKKYGGIMFTSMDADDFDGSCGTEQHLLSVMYSTLVESTD